jgi:hypothetical protein
VGIYADTVIVILRSFCVHVYRHFCGHLYGVINGILASIFNCVFSAIFIGVLNAFCGYFKTSLDAFLRVVVVAFSRA